MTTRIIYIDDTLQEKVYKVFKSNSDDKSIDKACDRAIDFLNRMAKENGMKFIRDCSIFGGYYQDKNLWGWMLK